MFGLFSATRTAELVNMKIEHLVMYGENILQVNIPKTKSDLFRSFTISEDYYFNIVEKYRNLRPLGTPIDHFFPSYSKNKCTRQVIGTNAFSKMPRNIISYLNLLDSDRYTGRSFPRSSATLLSNAGASTSAIEKHGEWKSTNFAERYIDDSFLLKK